ncbi:DNA-binding domain-containing protein [Novosphingobium sp. CECT 9465]|uniref:HvfC/BufC N-terminal domain-containing protein n=1 Tax=Novosphingobium sp. CECT 9465 TaxID=2829794 RepID=UPI001E358475|nr:DNA-binding domain-containing protein [Novosphingobium sp. CECT 9465]CAH0495246.1 hypothetical protein NVSP9465_00252 [Novosphingobium sp. CECT 9465]
MSLAALQQEFMAQVFDETHPLPSGWNARMDAGLAIYRGAYRARLIDALRDTFPKTALWVGGDAFEQAAAHHLIQHPPAGWTLDLAGANFAETLVNLFAGDPEVPELAWLEWSMHLAFTAPDTDPIDAAGFAAATREFSEEDWAGMQVELVPSLHCRKVGHDCGALWTALAESAPPASSPTLPKPQGCLVWREGFTPVFRLTSGDELQCLTVLRDGASFDEMCNWLATQSSPEEGVQQAGMMLGNWLSLGLVQAVTTQHRAIESAPD